MWAFDPTIFTCRDASEDNNIDGMDAPKEKIFDGRKTS